MQYWHLELAFLKTNSSNEMWREKKNQLNDYCLCLHLQQYLRVQLGVRDMIFLTLP